MKTLNLLFAFIFLFVNSLFSQSIPIRVRVKENINTTEQHINNLTEFQRSNAVFNNASFTSSYPGAETPLLKRVYDIRVTSDTTLAKQLLLETDYFEYVKIPKLIFVSEEVCDLAFPGTNDNYNYGVNYALKMIGASCAWDLTKGDPNILIGIADTDFNEFHEDLENKIGYLGGPISSENQHGSKVASVAAADTDNNVGIAAIGYNCNLALERVLHFESSMAYATDIETAKWNLYQLGIKIINLSWKTTGPIEDSDEIEVLIAATEEMTQNGTTLVVSAGNSADAFQHEFVADIPGVIMVSSVNSDKKHGDTGHAHNVNVDLCAPGINVPVVNSEGSNSYITANGTSFAAPYVAGTIGLLLSVNPCLTPPEIETIIKQSAIGNPIADADEFEGLVVDGAVVESVKLSVNK